MHCFDTSETRIGEQVPAGVARFFMHRVLIGVGKNDVAVLTVGKLEVTDRFVHEPDDDKDFSDEDKKRRNET